MRRILLSIALVSGVVLAGCGGGSGSSSTTTSVSTAADTTATTSVSEKSFPSSKGKRLSELREGMQEGLVLAPSVSVLQPGRNRYGFALFDAARKQVTGAPVAIYVSKNDGTGVRGPFIARSESLKVKPQYESRTTSQDPNAAKSVYVADVDFPAAGKYRVSAIARLDGRAVSTTSFGANVAKAGPTQPPAVGSTAPKVSTPTLDSVAGDAARIDTRNPPAPDLLKTNLSDVYGKKPVALLFATPALCTSRVCGPVVDVLEQVKAENPGDDVAFIHNEIYRGNRADQGVRPQVATYRLPSEPWLFMLDSKGRVVERLEGAFSAGELEKAIAKAKAAS